MWFLCNDKTSNGRDRRNEILFIDASNLGSMEERVLRVLSDKDISAISMAISSWRDGNHYADQVGFVRSVSIAEIEQNNFNLTPSRYVGFADTNPHLDLEHEIQELGSRYNDLIAEGAVLDGQILDILDGMK